MNPIQSFILIFAVGTSALPDTNRNVRANFRRSLDEEPTPETTQQLQSICENDSGSNGPLPNIQFQSQGDQCNCDLKPIDQIAFNATVFDLQTNPDFFQDVIDFANNLITSELNYGYSKSCTREWKTCFDGQCGGLTLFRELLTEGKEGLVLTTGDIGRLTPLFLELLGPLNGTLSNTIRSSSLASVDVLSLSSIAEPFTDETDRTTICLEHEMSSPFQGMSSCMTVDSPRNGTMSCILMHADQECDDCEVVEVDADANTTDAGTCFVGNCGNVLDGEDGLIGTCNSTGVSPGSPFRFLLPNVVPILQIPPTSAPSDFPSDIPSVSPSSLLRRRRN